MIGGGVNAITGSVGVLMNMTNHHVALQKFTLFSAIINVLLNYFLISYIGVIGAAISTIISAMVLNLLCVLKIKREFGFYAVFQW